MIAPGQTFEEWFAREIGEHALGQQDPAATLLKGVTESAWYAALSMPRPNFRVGMLSQDVAAIVNRHRTAIQQETPTIGDSVTCAAFLLWALLEDARRCDGRDVAESFAELARVMPAEAEAMGFRVVRAH